MVSLNAYEDLIQAGHPGCITRLLEEDPVHHASLETKLKLVKESYQGSSQAGSHRKDREPKYGQRSQLPRLS